MKNILNNNYYHNINQVSLFDCCDSVYCLNCFLFKKILN